MAVKTRSKRSKSPKTELPVEESSFAKASEDVKNDDDWGGELDPKEEKVLDWILKAIVAFVLGWLGLSILLVIGGYFGLWK